jgi:hypothetical protein
LASLLLCAVHLQSAPSCIGPGRAEMESWLSHYAFGLGSAAVPVAAAGVPPAAFRGDVFGRRPKTAGETPALPEKPRCSGWCSGWICVAKELFADKLLSWRPCARRAGSYHLSLNIVPEHGRRPKIAPSAAPHCRISIRIAQSRRVSEPSPGIRVLPARFIRAWLMDGNWVC